jgi:hypothetical protein
MKGMVSRHWHGWKDGITVAGVGFTGVVADLAIFEWNNEQEGWTGRVYFAYVLSYVKTKNLEMSDRLVLKNAVVDNVLKVFRITVSVGNDGAVPKYRQLIVGLPFTDV